MITRQNSKCPASILKVGAAFLEQFLAHSVYFMACLAYQAGITGEAEEKIFLKEKSKTHSGLLFRKQRNCLVIHFLVTEATSKKKNLIDPFVLCCYRDT